MLGRATRERLEAEVQLAARAAGEAIELLTPAEVKLPGNLGRDGLVAVSSRWVVVVWDELLGQVEQRAWARDEVEQPHVHKSRLGLCLSFTTPQGLVTLERFESQQDLRALAEALGAETKLQPEVAEARPHPQAQAVSEAAHNETPPLSAPLPSAPPPSADASYGSTAGVALDMPPEGAQGPPSALSHFDGGQPERQHEPLQPSHPTESPPPAGERLVTSPSRVSSQRRGAAPSAVDPRFQANRFQQQLHTSGDDALTPQKSLQELAVAPPSWTTPKVTVLAVIALAALFVSVLVIPERRQRLIEIFYKPVTQEVVEQDKPLPRGLMELDFGMTLDAAKEALPLMRAEMYQLPDAPSDGFVLAPPFLRGVLTKDLQAPDVSGTRWAVDTKLAGEPASCAMHFDGDERLSRITCRVRQQSGLDRHQVVEEGLLRGLEHNHGKPDGMEGVHYTADAPLDEPYRVSYLWIGDEVVLHLYSAYNEWRGSARSELVLDNFLR